jgi:16S rRNA (cytidine1402-2'-O)-methyltransferase
MPETEPKQETSIPALWLVPNTLGFLPQNTILADVSIKNIHNIRHFLVESRPAAHRFLKWIRHPLADRNVFMDVLNEETDPRDIPQLLAPLRAGNAMGVLSEAGLPGIADPGNLAVQWAHQNGFRVIPITGPSSVFLALAASGLNGQRFYFHGYLPDQPDLLKKRLRELEHLSGREMASQIFIEAPHRNESTFEMMLGTLYPETKICVAADVTLPTEFIRTLSVSKWKTVPRPYLKKRPVVFLFMA